MLSRYIHHHSGEATIFGARPPFHSIPWLHSAWSGLAWYAGSCQGQGGFKQRQLPLKKWKNTMWVSAPSLSRFMIGLDDVCVEHLRYDEQQHISLRDRFWATACITAPCPFRYNRSSRPRKTQETRPSTFPVTHHCQSWILTAKNLLI